MSPSRAHAFSRVVSIHTSQPNKNFIFRRIFSLPFKCENLPKHMTYLIADCGCFFFFHFHCVLFPHLDYFSPTLTHTHTYSCVQLNRKENKTLFIFMPFAPLSFLSVFFFKNFKTKIKWNENESEILMMQRIDKSHI